MGVAEAEAEGGKWSWQRQSAGDGCAERRPDCQRELGDDQGQRGSGRDGWRCLFFFWDCPPHGMESELSLGITGWARVGRGLRLTPTVKCTVGIVPGCFGPSADDPHVCPKHRSLSLQGFCTSTFSGFFGGSGSCMCHHRGQQHSLSCAFCRAQNSQHSTAQTTHLHMPRISPDRERSAAQRPVAAWLPSCHQTSSRLSCAVYLSRPLGQRPCRATHALNANALSSHNLLSLHA